MTNESGSQMNREVMSRVRFIHLGRALLSAQMIKAIVLLASVVSTLITVSVVHVANNLAHIPLSAYFSYVLSAYAKTSFNVQTAVLLGLVAGVWIVWDISRNLRGIMPPWQLPRIFARS